MGFNKVLVPLDGSEVAETALPYATKAASAGAWIHLFSVLDDNCFSEMAIRDVARMESSDLEKALQAATETSDEAAVEVFSRQKYLNRVAQALREQGFKITTGLELGYAINAIPAAACEGFDLIVISTHGRTGLSKILMGSVAETVVHQSPCPVLVVPARLPQP